MLLLNAKKRYRFTDKLNHRWDDLIDMRYLIQLPHNYSYNIIINLLDIHEEELYYVISDISEYDDVVLPFRQAFYNIDTAGFGAILVSVTADKIYLLTEAVQGGTLRFIGKK